MTDAELEELSKNVDSIRKAIRKNNPLLRSVASSRLYAALGFPSGIVFAGFCVIAHDASLRYGSFAAAPAFLKTAFWILLAILLVIGGWVKIVMTRKVARSIDAKSGFMIVVKAMFGGKTSGLIVSSFISIAGTAAFAVSIGKPWYIVPTCSILLSFAAFRLDLLIDLPEYRAMGWYSLVAGFASLFLIETAPFLWTAAVYGGMLVVFGIAGMVRPGPGRPARSGGLDDR